MSEQFNLIVELLLFTGYKDEAERLFCIYNHLSKDFGLCYNMISLTEKGLICRCAANGYYDTVKDLCEFYKIQFESHAEEGEYEYMTNRLCGSACDKNGCGPMFYALKTHNIQIYNLLKEYYHTDGSVQIYADHWDLGETGLVDVLARCLYYEWDHPIVAISILKDLNTYEINRNREYVVEEMREYLKSGCCYCKSCLRSIQDGCLIWRQIKKEVAIKLNIPVTIPSWPGPWRADPQSPERCP